MSALTLLRPGLALGLLLTGMAAYALPTNVNVTPPNGATFLPGQKFDLRVEGRGTGPFSAALAIDGTPIAFSSGVQNSTTTDGITPAGSGGFNLRGYFNNTLGVHTVTASFTDSTGTVLRAAQFTIIPVTGGRRPAKNIIICLGDGLGIGQRTAARLVKFGVSAGRPNGLLAMDQLPGSGLVTTHSLNSIITDSAPGMACYSTGNHFNNNQEGVYPANVTNPFAAPRVEYMAEYLKRTQGRSLGIVSTADVEDATPAANAVHTSNRNLGQGICDQYFDDRNITGLTVLMGGGRRWFLPNGQFGSSRSASNDYANLPADLQNAWNAVPGVVDANRNLITDFTGAGFTYAATDTDLKPVYQGTNVPTRLLGLFGYGNMNVALDKLAKRRNVKLDGASTFAVDDYFAPDQPMLEDMTTAALNVLKKNANGFVLMVEGAHIDKQSHYMDADRAIDETIEFDNAVARCRQFAADNGDTMIVVLADHECSGFSLIGALNNTVTGTSIAGLKALASDVNTTAPNVVPNRQAASVTGTYDSAGFPTYTLLADGYPATFDINGKLLIGFGGNADRYEGWLTKPQPVIDNPLIPTVVSNSLTGMGYPTSGIPLARVDHTPDPYGDSRGFFIRGQINGAQAVHTANDIPISAYSSSSFAYQQFYGVQENTSVFFKLMRAALGGY